MNVRRKFEVRSFLPIPETQKMWAVHGYTLTLWRSYRGFRRFNEPGPPSSWGPPSQATKKLIKSIIGILLKKN